MAAHFIIQIEFLRNISLDRKADSFFSKDTSSNLMVTICIHESLVEGRNLPILMEMKLCER